MNELLRQLPSVAELLGDPRILALHDTYAHPLVVASIRDVLEELRREVKAEPHTVLSMEDEIGNLPTRVEQTLARWTQPSLRRVINATGVILQTNLGRAPLSDLALQRVMDVASGYCNLELDLATGERKNRDHHVEQLVLKLHALRTGGAVDISRMGAAVVNNCAAACFLALNTLAEGGEVLVSRGELVEIGGGFRVPEILRKSGATLREVGTTNRTRIEDYAEAITPATRLILRVHRSNFRIEGFTEQPSLQELVALGREQSIPVMEDQGTGCVVDLASGGMPDEPSWIRSMASGMTLVACSGDKLMGGPQCGILTGEKVWIERIRKNPLFRAMRVDKLTYASLEATLLAYLTGTENILPVNAMIHMPAARIHERCIALAGELQTTGLNVDVQETRSAVGGGTTPGASISSFAVSLHHANVPESRLSEHLRSLTPAVMTRTQNGRVLLDLRTVQPDEDKELAELLKTGLEGLESPG